MGETRAPGEPMKDPAVTTLPVMPGPPLPTVDAPPIVLTVPSDVLVVVTRQQDDPTSMEIVVHHTQQLIINGQAAPAPETR
jgi:hypothetical protein